MDKEKGNLFLVSGISFCLIGFFLLTLAFHHWNMGDYKFALFLTSPFLIGVASFLVSFLSKIKVKLP